MFASDEELELFTDWILADIAERAPSGKNPTTPMRSVWMEYDDPNPKGRGKAGIRKGHRFMRGSDLPTRRYIAIRVLLDHGRSLKEACAEVALRLHRTTEKQLNSIASSFQKYSNPNREGIAGMFVQSFENWLEWMIQTNLIDSAIPFEVMTVVMRWHAEKILQDRKRAELFVEKWRRIVLRALAVVKSRRAPQGVPRPQPAAED